jgi:O-6-methylguanine DNA methyltransferase
VATPKGRFRATYSAVGLAGLEFPSRGFAARPRTSAVIPLQLRQWHRATCAAVNAVLAGRAPTRLPPLDLTAGTAFQRAIWRVLRRIAAGQTRSYGEIARTIGKPRASRAVGSACGANPIPLLVPCHRVLAANGRLGGFSGGLDWKRRLLEAEEVAISP